MRSTRKPGHVAASAGVGNRPKATWSTLVLLPFEEGAAP